jgi:acyl-coenzyme A synthetase/AMP-(fatty) acid ligase/acyl carrier protein
MIPFSRDEIEGSIGQRFRHVAASIPARPAVQTSTSVLTYGELDAASDHIARLLISLRGAKEDPIGILLPRSPEWWMIFFAAAKAGKSIIMFPPDFPDERLAAIWHDAERPLVLSNRHFIERGRSFISTPDLLIDMDALPGAEQSPAGVKVRPETPIVIAYTSGTTGRPKGMVWPNRFLMHDSWSNHTNYQLTDGDKFATISGDGTSVAITQPLSMLLSGVTLVLRGCESNEWQPLSAWLREQQISVFSLPALAVLQQQLAAMTIPVALPSLRLMLLSGWELTRRELEIFRQCFASEIGVWYRYACSETSLITQHRMLPRSPLPWDKVPVGFPGPDKEIRLLDETGAPVPPGEVGEVAVRTRYMTTHYWNNPAQTDEKFLPDPEGGDKRIFLTGDLGRMLPGGMYAYHGRKDNIVRIRGYSIQLSDVEQALQKITGVSEAAAHTFPMSHGDNRLVAYVVPTAGADLNGTAIREAMATALPNPMLPSAYVLLEKLPRTPMGRVDRIALPPPGSERPVQSVPFAAPQNETQKRLCDIWKDILRLDEIGIRDNFFELGGDSLLVLNLSLAVEKAFSRPIPISFFRNPNIAALVQLWESEDARADKEEKSLIMDSVLMDEDSSFNMHSPTLTSPSADHAPRFPQRKKRRSTISLRAVSFASAVAAHLPYEEGCRWVAQCCKSILIRETFLRGQSELFRDFCAALGDCPDAPPDALPISLMGNILWAGPLRARVNENEGPSFLDRIRVSTNPYWRSLGGIIDRGAGPTFERLFCVYGWEHLERSYRKGRGIILVSSHTTAGHIATAAIPKRLGCKTIPTISQFPIQKGKRFKTPAKKPKTPIVDPSTSMAEMMIEAQHILQQGQIVQIVPDSDSTMTNDQGTMIGGRIFHLTTGFAKLAMLFGADVIPLYTTRRLDGSLHTHFFPALESRPSSGDDEDQTRQLLRGYGEFVELQWRSAPESVRWTKMERYLQMPIA